MVGIADKARIGDHVAENGERVLARQGARWVEDGIGPGNLKGRGDVGVNTQASGTFELDIDDLTPRDSPRRDGADIVSASHAIDRGKNRPRKPPPDFLLSRIVDNPTLVFFQIESGDY